jgi:endonuclease/exonuclease/phosphatase family metal-dependent hydrolase
VTVVYGPSEDSEKAAFLEELTSISPGSQMQWMVPFDFNLIYEARDKNNTNLNRKLMGRFRHALDRCELLEFALQNRRFTWSNEREQPTLVRLDRVFPNRDWDLVHGDFKLQALSSSLSDHCPLLLSPQDKPVIRESFRFENFWPRVPGFREVVLGAWNEQVLVYPP